MGLNKTGNGGGSSDCSFLGKATATLTLTPEEMSQIYSRLYDMNVMGLQKVSSNISSAGTRCAKIPYYTESWNITVAGKSKTLEWSDESCEVTSEAKQLSALRQFIHGIVETKAEYKALPDAVGGV
ncbi:hypothetical protein [Paenibacillus silvae]|uniref:hypothetical protein n=1 Tax=Paenibacillus silvae TaxID=1325358 RepID=UPI0011B4CCDF|nr:hypothetical protein [Paenibacillus silvae]